ncbi:PQQ-dependent sugar dehydrogenase [Phyllobacterium salinisoli]|uniref:PQQ-dependent sugar dehydrogenase n=1 Tax=Phyllobacterium salinisoli TaxID=1899321 RepID=A0A368K845_9HYPH|nr:PQQ-dependent sugar dehydrogenase [Phyllobacterium salinisoli]RCS25527.1 PQQ-dependent sugar dehydrogenase [Phyllobacterium salinisoli]
MTNRTTIAIAGLFAIAATTLGGLDFANAQDSAREIATEKVKVKAETVATGLASPWSLAFLPDGALLVTEKAGTMRIVRNGELSEPISGVPKVWNSGQGGLLDVALAPDFEKSGAIYFTYSEPGSGGAGTAIASARLVDEGETARLIDVKTLFSTKKKTSRGQHFGSRIVVAPDNTLFVTFGERGDMNRAQDSQDPAGSVLRINADGSVPADNPFADGQKALPQIWSTGHRNPQGAAWDPVTDSLWITEHGARGGDEVNRPEAGKNYGWPVISYGRHYSGAKIGTGTAAEGYEQPLHYWDPSIAPSGLAVYDGAMFPEWQGDLLAGALKHQMLVRLDRDGNARITGEERMFKGEFGRIRDVRVAPDGSVYLLPDGKGASIIRLSRA